MRTFDNIIQVLPIAFALTLISSCAEPVETQNNFIDLSIIDTSLQIKEIEWEDGDSGVINQNIPFELARYDAPEITSNGFYAPLCDLEKAKGEEIKVLLESMSVNDLSVDYVFGVSDDNKLLIMLTFKGTDIGVIGVRNGLMAEWDMVKGLIRNDPKPKWCDVDLFSEGRNPFNQDLCFVTIKRFIRRHQKPYTSSDRLTSCQNYVDLYERLKRPYD